MVIDVHVDDIVMSREKDVWGAFFDELKERSQVNQRELKMYTACTFLRDWESGVLEMNPTTFAEILMA